MKTQELKIEGMTCGHCVMSVQKELGKIPGVKVEKVEIGSAKVQFDETKVNPAMLANAINEAGYKVV